MSIFKCKMCGGSLEISADQTTAVCEYCGTQQTLPKLGDDRRANLYDRANHFRRNNEFDKAMSIYENILSEDGTDAEAYWSLVLCRYGIEYVEDPATHKRVPTVNRAQFTSIFDDDNYKSALSCADGYQKSIYEAEAKAINEIQKGILAISQKEEPFDVFICYKETDNNGRRTPDSVLANDLYHQLTAEGFKVFFARITLEDKLGVAYEPYIFAALNSARVMVALGTRPEYFKAVWVKNEWSRYLALVGQSGGKKVLIPAYKDMDPYDLPEEFSHLQAQDMGKLGFMQDLIRGVKKLAQTEAPASAKETVVVNTAASANTAPLLRRAFMYLEDGTWSSADEYCEKVLDQEPENAEAYLGKLMAELRCKKQEHLKNQAKPFDYRNNYQKILRFGDAALKEQLMADVAFIKDRNENARKTELYNAACNEMADADTEEAYENAAEQFAAIPGFRDADTQKAKCLEKAEIARKDEIYSDAQAEQKEGKIPALEEASRLYASIPGWKDADEQVYACKKKIEEIKAKEEADRLERERREAEAKAERERQAELARQEAERKAKRNKKIAIIICAVIAFVIILNTVIIPNGKYNDAVALMDAGKYEEAIAAFTALGGYKDSTVQIANCETAIMDGKYNDAVALMDAGKTIEAYKALAALNGYKDSAEKAASIFEDYKMARIKAAKVGDYVFFGQYEQDNNGSNGKENVEWLVLDVKDGKALVISKYALDCQEYNTAYENITWENCTLRTWLNITFLNTAFSVTERAMIPTVTVSADKNPEYSTNPGNATQDKVFLLSITEANKYFSSDSARACKPTAYTKAQGAYVADNGNCCWWLRSPGYFQDNAAFVGSGGGVSEGGDFVNRSSSAVRPALWIDLGSE